jgi:hypothetical protein
METAKKSGWNSCRRPTRELSVNPNGIASSSPRLARQRLPWVTDYQIINRNAVVVNIARDGRTGMAATALRLGIFCGR